MSLFVACQCGRAFEVPDDHPGGTVKCPDCGRDVAVAAPAPSDAPPEPVETVEAQREGDLPAGDPPPRPQYEQGGFGYGGGAGGPQFEPNVRQVDLRGTGASCLLVIGLIVAVAIAVPQFGAALVASILGCCVLPLLIVGVAAWWRLRQFKKMIDPNRRPSPPPDA